MTGSVTSDERSLRLRQLNELHNSLLNTAKETFCPALRWAMDQLGCPDAAAKRTSSVRTWAQAARDLDDEIYGRHG